MIDVGTELLMVDPIRGRSEPDMNWVRVSKVGRKWATLVSREGGYDKGRCEVETLRYDGGGYHTSVTLYGSMREYEETTQTHKLWREIVEVARGYSMPKHLSLADLGIIASMLRSHKDPTQ